MVTPCNLTSFGTSTIKSEWLRLYTNRTKLGFDSNHIQLFNLKPRKVIYIKFIYFCIAILLLTLLVMSGFELT